MLRPGAEGAPGGLRRTESRKPGTDVEVLDAVFKHPRITTVVVCSPPRVRGLRYGGHSFAVHWPATPLSIGMK